MVRFGDDAPVFHAVRVVIFAAAKPRCCEAEAKRNALDGRNGESKLADFVFQSAEHRLAEPGGNACDLAADEASDGVFFRTRSCNRGLHVFGRFVACHGEVLPVDRREKFGRVLDSGNRVNARHDLDATCCEQLLANAARNAQGSGQPAGEVSAAGNVLIAAEFYLRGIVGVTRAGDVDEIAIILRACIRVVDYSAKRRAAGRVSNESRKKFRQVCLFSRRRPCVLAGGSSAKKCAELVHVDGKTCRKSGEGHADGGAMGLAEDGKLQRVAMIKAAHRESPFSWSSVFQNSGYDLDVHCAPRTVTGSRHPPARTAASIAIR